MRATMRIGRDLNKHYSLGRKLGEGVFGTTYLCVEKTTRKRYACKLIPKSQLETETDVEDVRREIKIMQHLSTVGDPNIIMIKEAYEDVEGFHIVMELCVGGELYDRLQNGEHYTEEKAAVLAKTIVGVLETCHSSGVMHRDVKPDNFMFVNQEEDSPIKMIDFGLSVFFKPGETFNEAVGSPDFVAPEVLREEHYGPKADVWCAGVIIYVLLSGCLPFWGETDEEISKQILEGEIDFISDPWPSISETAKDLLKRMLLRDPDRRPTAYEVLCHPWFNSCRVAIGVTAEKEWIEEVLDKEVNKSGKQWEFPIVECICGQGTEQVKELGHEVFQDLMYSWLFNDEL